MIKSRNPASSPPAQPAQSLEVVRQRARHRLIGASVLVFLGVVGFPLLFDTEPRPLSVDVPIDIPAKGVAGQVNSLTAQVANKPSRPANPSPTAKTPLPLDAGLSKQEMVVEPLGSAHVQAPQKPEAKPPSRAETAAKKVPGSATTQVSPKPPAAASAAAVQPATGQRFIIQLGSFADNAKAQALRYKVEANGLKTYIHVIETANGKLTRVRVGPFATRAEADRVDAKLKAIGLSGRMLSL